MPQPYPSHIFPTVKIDTNAILQERPYCLARGMAAIAQHSSAESMVSNVLVAMLEANPAPTAAVYGAIRNGDLQREALMAVAREVRTEERCDLFKRVLKLLSASASGRDKLAHSLWAIDGQFPQAVVLVNPDSLWRFSAQAKGMVHTGSVDVKGAEEMQKGMQKACSIWNEQDLIDVRARGVRAFHALVSFSILLAAKNKKEADAALGNLNSALADCPGK